MLQAVSAEPDVDFQLKDPGLSWMASHAKFGPDPLKTVAGCMEQRTDRQTDSALNIVYLLHFYDNNNGTTYRYAGSDLQKWVSEWLNHDHF